MPGLIGFDKKYGPLVAGADEAGRGCCAGPLIGAAVAFDYRELTKGELKSLMRLNDSKKLTERLREELYLEILSAAKAISVTSISVRSIERGGLQPANLRALGRSLENLRLPKAHFLADGYDLKELGCVKLIKGDSQSAAIAAASIVAKVTRDRYMQKLDLDYSGYGFAKHKGYPTKQHLKAIKALGYTPHHRKSYNLSLPD